MNFITKTILFSIAIAILGYFGFPYLTTTSVEPQLTFSAGLLIAGIIVSLAANAFNLEADGEYSADEEEEQQTLYVGNLAYRVNEGQIRELFAKYGTVHSVRLMRDRKSGKRKGFGFVEMNKSGAHKAIKKLNDTDFAERTLKIREANDKPERD